MQVQKYFTCRELAEIDMTLSAEEMADKVDMTHREHVSNIIYYRFRVLKLVFVCFDNKSPPLFGSLSLTEVFSSKMCSRPCTGLSTAIY